MQYGSPVISTEQAELVTVWSIRLAVAAYLLGLAAGLSPALWRVARVCWTAGCLLCLVHIALAMHFYHYWSHAAAYADTARQTREAAGVEWGGGVWFNYLFAALWLADVLWWWALPASRAVRTRWLSAALHAYLAFIIFNATIVFESGPTRWVTLVACTLLIGWWMLSRLRRERSPG
jgi:hypothetical protein